MRTMAEDALVEPWPGPDAASTSVTGRPARLAANATLLPTTPAPMTTTGTATRRVCPSGLRDPAPSSVTRWPSGIGQLTIDQTSARSRRVVCRSQQLLLRANWWQYLGAAAQAG